MSESAKYTTSVMIKIPNRTKIEITIVTKLMMKRYEVFELSFCKSSFSKSAMLTYLFDRMSFIPAALSRLKSLTFVCSSLPYLLPFFYFFSRYF
jgi:hypothetical protein